MFLLQSDILFGNSRYEGFAIDLTNAIAEEIGFKVEFQIVEDGKVRFEWI